MSTPAKTRRARPERNTYGLPQGTRIRLALRRFFAEQRRAVLVWLVTGEISRKALTRREFKAISHGHAIAGVGRLDGPDPHVGLGDRRPRATPDAAGGIAGAATKDDPPIPAGFPDFETFGLGDEELARRMVPLLQLIWDDAAGVFAETLGLDPEAFRVDNPLIAEAVDAAALAFAESTNETTSLLLEDALAEVRAAILSGNTGPGLSYDALTEVINAIFDTASQSRARTIAITESARAVHAAQELLAVESGVVKGWKWLASEDACPLCTTIARRCPFVRIGRPFAIVGDDPDYSVIKFPPAHPRCQCSRVEVLDIDDDPRWSETLVQPVPEPQDYPPEEG